MINSTFSRFLLVCSLWFTLSTVRAQYVPIPDPVFVNWLNTWGCGPCLIYDSIVGWQLDTTCPAVLSMTTVAIFDTTLRDLTGIQYFHGLTTLQCYSDELTYIPSLVTDSNIVYLWVQNDQLTALPELPYNLRDLQCDNNHLTSLPTLPPFLSTLSCSSNQITELPFLPATLGNLNCSNNPGISCLPYISQSYLTDFFISNTNISCLPNTFNAQVFDINPAYMPICNAINGCGFYDNIAGDVYLANGNSCWEDSINLGYPLSNIKLMLKQNNTVREEFFTLEGTYTFEGDSLLTYQIELDTTGLPFSIVCPTSSIRLVPLSFVDSSDLHEDFALKCPNMVDYGVMSITSTYIHPFRYTIITPIDISCGNIALMKYNAHCLTNLSGVVTTIYSGSIKYISPAAGALTPSSVNGDTLTYYISDLDSLQLGDFSILFSTDTNAVIGSPVHMTSIITPSTPDANPGDDTLKLDFVIHDPNDPNMKEVSPVDTVQSGGWLTYTVYFQNTGNDTARNVVVNDTLSPYVDASSFQYLASSNKAVMQLFGSTCVFTFPRINLPDSIENPTGSIGWIQYKVKTLSNLPVNTQVSNTAYVYFDANPAVVTNTTINTVDTLVPLVCTDTTIIFTHSICEGDSFIFSGMHLISAGTYSDTMTRIGGCDSIVILNLTVNQPPLVSWLQTDTVANIWCLCAFWVGPHDFSGEMPMGGVFSGTYVSGDSITEPYIHCNQPFFDTSFAVVYTYTETNGCSSSVSKSFGLNMGCEGIEELGALNAIHLYPNPNKGSFSLQTSNSIGTTYTISDMLGNTITQQTIRSDNQEIELPEVAEGVYTLVVKGTQPISFVVVK